MIPRSARNRATASAFHAMVALAFLVVSHFHPLAYHPAGQTTEAAAQGHIHVDGASGGGHHDAAASAPADHHGSLSDDSTSAKKSCQVHCVSSPAVPVAQMLAFIMPSQVHGSRLPPFMLDADSSQALRPPRSLD